MGMSFGRRGSWFSATALPRQSLTPYAYRSTEYQGAWCPTAATSSEPYNAAGSSESSPVDSASHSYLLTYYLVTYRERNTHTQHTHTFNGPLSGTTRLSRYQKGTGSSAIAERPRDAPCQLKSCQFPRNSAETTCTTSPEPSISCR